MSATAVAATALTLMVAPSAQANTSPSGAPSVSQDVGTPSRLLAGCYPGDLCFEDYNNGTGRVAGTNWNWLLLHNSSGRNWNDRADYFYNNGEYKKAVIHEDISHRGDDRVIARYDYTVWYDTVSSNKWVW